MPLENRTLDAQEDSRVAGTTIIESPEQIESFDADSIARLARPNHLPLSFAQQRLWFLDQLHPESSLYNFSVALRLQGNLDEPALQRSLAEIVSRHEVLRTRFVAVDGNPTQVISPETTVELPVKDLSGLSETSREDEARRLLDAEARRPFNLAQDLMMRCLLLRMGAQEHILMVTTHHIATDAWSAGIFFRELAVCYEAFHIGREPELPKLEIQYADFALWQQERLKGELFQEQLAYWKKTLEGAKEFLELPVDRPRRAVRSYAGSTLTRPFRAGLMEALRQFSQRERATLFMTMLTAWKVLLHRYAGQEDILVGMPIANRSRMETEKNIGFFVNTVIVRSDMSGNPTFRDFLRRVRDVTFDAFEHQDLPFEKLVAELHPERNNSQTPFIQAMFVLQNPPTEGMKLADLRLTPVEVPSDSAKFDLTLFIEERGREGVAALEYNTDLFDATTISRMLGHLEQLLEGIMANPNRRLSELPLLTGAERQQLLVEWNQTKSDYPSEKSIHELFEEQVLARPEAPAVIFGERQLSYRELDTQANQLARYLAHNAVKQGDLVAICLERSAELIVALLAILKAGAAYASLDPASPKERAAMMLEDLHSPLVLTQEKFRSLFQKHANNEATTAVICVDADSERIARESEEPPGVCVPATSLAYVSFTSGSTGRPKGVCVPHRGVVRLAKNTNFATFSPDETFLQMAPVSFDASTLEMWCCLLNGARLVVMPPEIPSLSDLSSAIRKHQVTTAWFTSGLFNQLVDEEPEALKSLRQILAGGDVLSPSHVKRVLEWPGTRRLINGYGPTENTTFTACYTVPADFSTARPVPIGRPIANTQCYILDATLQPVPIGVVGELFTGGEGLATGYLDQPELTAEKFISNPFIPGARLYRTGDLARYLPDGNIEFLGRADGQVKIRGFRIELGEIETALNSHPDIRECVVITVQDHNEKSLAAYFVSLKQPIPIVTDLREFLQTKLPDYMVPSNFIPIGQIPLTPNGKVDRRALPLVRQTLSAPDKKVLPPKDALESELTAIWESVLEVKPIGVNEKFFELGGHSLMAVRLVARLEKKFGRKFPLSMVFQAQTVAQMADYLRAEPASTPGSSVVALQSGGSKPPVYFVHGVGGGMFWGYTNLARSVGPDQPVYVLKSRAMDGQEEFARIEEMAAQYVADIRAMQPEGPYHLGGYCFGGIVAYEMARQLQSAGEKVAMLAVMNSAPPNSNYWRFRWTPVSLLKFARNMGLLFVRCMRWDPQQRKQFLRWKAQQARRKMSRMLKMPLGGSYHFNAEEVVDLSSFTRDQRKLWESHIRALIQYVPGRYPGKVTLFRSRGHPMLCSYDSKGGWTEFVDDVEVHIVPGEHESILEEPHVRTLTAELKNCLRRIHSPEPSTASVTSGEKANDICSDPVSAAVETSAEYPRDLCVHQLFEEQVRRTPNAPALLVGAERLTYAEVNRRANQLAHHLEALGVGPDIPVGISLQRSAELVIGLLAILKAGGAYVPLDPTYPRERLSKMLENSRAPILLTQQQFASALPAENSQIVFLDEPLPAGLKETNPTPRVSPNNLAYVIYTSGSTGQPKGVAMEHRPLVNLLWWQLKNSAMGEGDRTLQFASASFDVSFQEIFSTWCSGGELVLISEEMRHDPQELTRLLVQEKVSRLFLPFIALNHLSESVSTDELRAMHLKEVITAGEQLRITNKIISFFDALPGCSLHNHYGPSESHVVTSYRLNGPPSSWPNLPSIGKPIANTQIHLLDQNLKPVAAGESGELYIAGDCLARGYLYRPELTDERFIKNPFSSEPGAKMYKAGDLARQLPDGNIEFLGRVDHQVKIRGYRVELSEIEAVLGKHPGVRECAVAAREDVPGQRRLVGYIVRQPSHMLTVSELRRAVLEKLPDYMAPSAFVFLDALPLTPSGKVNRLALPAPDENRPQLGGEFVSAANETEAKIISIWSDVLHVKDVGTTDNFFELGGNSLSAGRVISRIRETFKVEIPVSCLFEAPTIAALAEGLGKKRWTEGRSAPPALKRFAKRGNPPLSFTQGRLWFIDRLEPGTHAYNVPAAVRLRGPLDLDALQKSLDRIVSRHESLRTTVSFSEGNLAQVISPAGRLKLSMVNCETVPASQREAQARSALEKEARRPFDLAHGPLARCTVVRLSEQEHIFVVVMHHIISDGWSLTVFFKELDLLYNAYASNRVPPILSALPVQYADYTLWQQQWMQGEVLDRHISYWIEKLKGAPLSLELPLDPPSQTTAQGRSGLENLVLPKATMEALQKLCRREGMTPFMALLAALAITLQRWTEQSDMVIGTVVAGRNSRELENLIGCFMNFIPLRMTVAESATAAALLKQVKAVVIEAHAHQDCPFEKIVEAVNPQRKASENPLYNVALLMQNFPSAGIGGKMLKSEPVAVDLQAALLDLRFIAEEIEGGISIACEYKADLFTPQTIEQLMASFSGVLAALLQEPAKKISQYELLPLLEEQCTASRNREDRQSIAVAATFTAEPVEDALKYWMKELDVTAHIEFAPYNQVFQQLLDPSSVFGANQRGLNVVFLRLEDWEKTETDDPEAPKQSDKTPLERSVNEFITVLKSFASRAATPCLVCICPSSKSVLLDAERAALHQRMEEFLASSLGSIAGAYMVTSKEISHFYPVAESHDARAEAFGAIPYTMSYFAALGTMVARKFHALKRPAFKVIVLDCDQTLWSGVCGEDGPDGIQLDPSRRMLQEFMRAQSAAGMLLCVCSKNNEADVATVFDRRREMPLRKEHFAAWRVNWQSKSENLKELASELHVGLDSFIFVDDNPVECAEVAANCPQVLTLQLPEPPEEIPQFLNHCWAFDHLKISTEDRHRNASYQQERQREELRAQSLSLSDFLAGLDLKIEITRMTPEQLTRVSQLTLRTNQFNFTTHRRNESDLQALLRGGKTEVLTVTVKDRFGAYGLVGVMTCEPRNGALEVETFLLSCRVLGRGVECHMVRRLGQAALARGLARVDLNFVSSEKNQPAFSFLEKIGSRFRHGASGGYVYRLPAEFAAGVAPDAGFVENKRMQDTAVTPASATSTQRRKFKRYGWIARELNDADKIIEAVDSKFRLHTHDAHNIAPPVTETEKILCKIWQDLLRRDNVGVRDNFFELGGHSLLAVRLFSEIERLTGRKLPLVTLFQSPTIKELADVLSQASASRSCLVGIHAQGSRPPLFLIHGAGGDVLWGYANLAPYLGDDQPVYGVKSRALDGSDEFGSIEEMAAHYIEQIRSLQPEGPYYLGGYCFGGNVAYEIARQLEAQGAKVDLVALLDSAPSNASYEKMRWWTFGYDAKFAVNLYYWLEEFFQWKAEERRAFVKRKARAWSRKVVRKLAPNRKKSAEVDLEEVIDLSKFPPHELRLWQIHLDILVRHVSQPYNGRVTLFRTRGQPLFCSLEEDFGWGKLVRDGVDLRIISGAHESIFIEPNVRLLAQKLRECLNNVAPAAKPLTTELQPT